MFVSPCEAHVLRLVILMEEDQETQNIPLKYALNYAPGGISRKIRWYVAPLLSLSDAYVFRMCT